MGTGGHGDGTPRSEVDATPVTLPVPETGRIGARLFPIMGRPWTVRKFAPIAGVAFRNFRSFRNRIMIERICGWHTLNGHSRILLWTGWRVGETPLKISFFLPLQGGFHGLLQGISPTLSPGSRGHGLHISLV